MAHTPGPWRADQEGGWVVLNGSHAYSVRDICSDDRGWNPDDLRLIAAAPDLLDALKKIEHKWRCGDGNFSVGELCRTVIRQAEGGET